MWYKILADGTEVDIVNADSPKEALAIVKLKSQIFNSDITFDGIHWTYQSV